MSEWSEQLFQDMQQMSISKQTELLRPRFEEFEHNRLFRLHSPRHNFAIVMQKGKPNRLECSKCGKICQSQEESETGEC